MAPTPGGCVGIAGHDAGVRLAIRPRGTALQTDHPLPNVLPSGVDLNAGDVVDGASGYYDLSDTLGDLVSACGNGKEIIRIRFPEYATRAPAADFIECSPTWLKAHPRFQVHFTPTYSSWINQVERFSAYVTADLLQRSDHLRVQSLEGDIRNRVTEWNDNPKPFIWAIIAEQILESLKRLPRRINGAGHQGDLQ